MGPFDLFPDPQYPDPPDASSSASMAVAVAYNPAINPPKSPSDAVVATPGAPLTFTVPAGASRVRFTFGPTETPDGADPIAAWCGAIKRTPARDVQVKPGDVVTVTPLWLSPESLTVAAGLLSCEVRAAFEAAAAGQ